uniref:Uncharacterized protein n=1 Tax=Leersia perrieri TaxID=77586 RepID=A0A0D9V9I4_9ORYZ
MYISNRFAVILHYFAEVVSFCCDSLLSFGTNRQRQSHRFSNVIMTAELLHQFTRKKNNTTICKGMNEYQTTIDNGRNIIITSGCNIRVQLSRRKLTGTPVMYNNRIMHTSTVVCTIVQACPLPLFLHGAKMVIKMPPTTNISAVSRVTK